MEEKQRSIEEMKLFSNKLRRDIIKVLSEVGSLSFTMLKEELDLTDGRLYFHLKKLNYYIEKDKQNFYRLNLEGKRVYNDLFHVSVQKEFNEDLGEYKSSGFLDFIAPSDIFYFLVGSKYRSFIEINILLIVLCWLFGVTNQYFSSIERIVYGGAIVLFLINLFHWYFYLGLILLGLKIFKIETETLDISICVFTGILPYYFYLLPIGILNILQLTIPSWLDAIFVVLFIIAKVWSTLIITQGLAIITNLKPYKTFLIALSLIFIDYIYLMITL